MPLKLKSTQPLIDLSRRDAGAENALFLRLQDVAGEWHSDYNCAVQGSNGGFIVILSDPGSGKDVSAWSGSGDGIVIDFRAWLQRTGLAQKPTVEKVRPDADNEHPTERLGQPA
jgi:hypothetical protein